MNEELQGNHITQRKFREWCQNYFAQRPKALGGLSLTQLSNKDDIFHYRFPLPDTKRVYALEKMVPAALSRELAKSLDMPLKALKDRVGFNIDGNTINLFSSTALSQETEKNLLDKFNLTTKQALSNYPETAQSQDKFDHFILEIKPLSLQEKAAAIIENKTIMGRIAEAMGSFKARKTAPEAAQTLSKKRGLGK